MTQEQKAEMATLYAEGLTLLQIAERLKVCYATVHRNMPKEGRRYKNTGRSQEQNDELLAKMVAMHHAGYSYGKIAKETSLTASAVFARLRRAGVATPPEATDG